MKLKNWNGNYDANVSELVGLTIDSINGKVGDDELMFHMADGSLFRFKYYEDCCARCDIEEIHGDLQDLVGSPILSAEEVVSNENPPGVEKQWQDSFTWTFYKFSTIKGSVTVRWYGESNGYYSESVTFERLA